MLQTVILAGGLGTRLRPLTENIPKVMSPFNDKPFLLYIIDLLKRQKISDIVLCVGYLSEMIKNHFGDGKSLDLSIRYSEEKDRLLGTGGAIKNAQNLLDDHFLILNGDTYLPIDYTEVNNIFLKYGKKAVIVVYNNTDTTGVSNNVMVDQQLKVVAYDKENPQNLKYVDAGAIILKKEVLDYVPANQPTSLENIYQMLIKEGELMAYVTEQRFYDVGTPRQQEDFSKYMEQQTK
ncbi:MAG: NTP transferase domain-containing protein [Chloroflexi bacterium]|nr:NTP transferase domain-containing protein [Chloroflexota bacterium]